MSWFLVKSGEPGSIQSRLTEWQIDDDSDIQTPPESVAPGSIAYTADRSVTYALSNTGEWVETVGGGSGGGQSGGDGISVLKANAQVTEDSVVLDKTAKEIYDTFNAGNIARVYMMGLETEDTSTDYIMNIVSLDRIDPVEPSRSQSTMYNFYAISPGGYMTFTANGDDDYPKMYTEQQTLPDYPVNPV